MGCFNSDLEVAFNEAIDLLQSNRNHFQPIEVLHHYRLLPAQLRREWVSVLLSELEMSFKVKRKQRFLVWGKSKVPKIVKSVIKNFLKRPFWRPRP
jgi:hypothetical protein